MSEESTVVTREKPKKKRSLWWLKLLLVLIVFAGGVVAGLKLSTMPLPYDLKDRLFPAAQAGDPAATPGVAEAAPAVTPTEAPAATTAPKATPAPTAKPTPAATPAPTAKPESTAKADAAPAESAEPETTAAPAPEATAEAGAFEPVIPATPAVTEAPEAPAETEAPQAAVPAGQYIGIDAALKAALDRAGVSESSAQVYGVYKTKEDGVTVYTVSFAVGATEYEYTVNALTGEIEGWRTIRTGAGSQTAAPEESFDFDRRLITSAEARKAAFDHAGVKEETASRVTTELEYENDTIYYEVEFHSGIYKYEYQIDAYSAAVLSYTKK